MQSTDDEKSHVRRAVKESKIILLLRIVPNTPTDDFKTIWECFQERGFKSTGVVRIRKTKELFILRRVDALSDVHLRLSEYFIERISPRFSRAQNTGCITLGIHINDEYTLATAREGMGKIHGYGGFPNASLVVHNRDNVVHTLLPCAESKLRDTCILDYN